MKDTKEILFTLKKYDTIEEIVAASFDCPLEDIQQCAMGGFDSDENDIEFSFEDQKKGIEAQGVWGWIDEQKVIHYWLGKELPMEDLIHFFAHEIGHRTGEPDKDDFKEEMRAEGYGRTATLAYEFAKQVKENQ